MTSTYALTHTQAEAVAWQEYEEDEPEEQNHMSVTAEPSGALGYPPPLPTTQSFSSGSSESPHAAAAAASETPSLASPLHHSPSCSSFTSDGNYSGYWADAWKRPGAAQLYPAATTPYAVTCSGRMECATIMVD